MSTVLHSELPAPPPGRRELTHEDWLAEGTARFGADRLAWRFVCPCCKHVAAISDWKAAGAPLGSAGISCVGRWAGNKRLALADGPGPCDYAGLGLFRFNPVRVFHEEGHSDVFEFAPAVPA